MIIHNTFADFVVFLYVHVSQADSSYDPAELAAIKTRMTSLYPSGTDIERKLYSAIREYNAFDKSKLNDLLSVTAKHFSSDQSISHNNVVETLHEIVKADGKIDQSESTALETLKQLMRT